MGKATKPVKAKAANANAASKSSPKNKPVGGSSKEAALATDNESGSTLIDYRMEDIRGTFLRCLSFIYFIAFLSIYLQAEGIYGTNGVTPVKAELKLDTRNPSQCMKEKFSLLCWVPQFFGIDGHRSLELLAIFGTLLSALGAMCVHCCVVPVFAILWTFYYSIFQVGGIFLQFQWDILLLETGVLAILIAPWLPTKRSLESKPRDLMTLWMVKWLLFRLMFASGIVKLQSGCPTWWGLTALNYHFESQCLPTAVAYFAHHFPAWLLKLMTVGTYYVEILVPFGFFAPFKTVRRLSFYIQILFQISIIVTGNYTFFNLLTMVLCISLLDGDYFANNSRKERYQEVSVRRVLSRSFTFTLIGLSLYCTYKYFGIALNPDNTIASKIVFQRKDFDWFTSVAVPYSVIFAFLTLASTSAQALVVSIFDVKGVWNKLTSVVSTLVYGALCIGLFAITLVPFTSLHQETHNAIWPSVQEAHKDFARYHLTSSYGLFRRMTGTEKGRPEIIMEYADDQAGPWKEYQFMYKPGNISAAPVLVAPHQPRLDWQMWFAALGTYHNNPWFVSLTYRMLQGEPSVLRLLDSTKLPLKTPKFVRASLYHYTYTKSQNAKDWWTRKREKEFMPVFSKDTPALVEFVKNLGHLQSDVPKRQNDNLNFFLDSIRATVHGQRPEHVIWGALITMLIVILTSKLVKN